MSVSVASEGHVAVIKMTGDGRHNPLSVAVVTAMLEAFESADVSGARAVVICSAAKSFCAGANIPDLLEANWMSRNPKGPTPEDLFARIEAHDRPVIAAVHGNVIGGGFELALTADLVVAAADSRFALPETGLGVIPNTALPRLAAMVGMRRAMEIVMTRRLLTAAECHTLGLVTAITEESPRDAAIAQADAIVSGAPPGAIAAVKRELRRLCATDWAQVRSNLAALPQNEWREGLSAFVEKRPPDYDGFWSGS
ncbi:enoyl-CoA hydratase/isomerase family protein [Pikeienuella piscinae]|uniref:Enoyl-CoA hydratase/isomerase family protein n=1 Tax=Pikeienuella piscinae TaxID=2748098 RepID=A0A7L5BYY3_9RHOB|nr:enoyl-CoA hydratase/isomerase family protein [Pikeienuella piscinae]QIE56681.1 enoyl-CoA hydratase/isomerase family protein [Pikeienuella piscinae]